MTPAVLGEFCARCGARCTKNMEPAPEGDKEVLVYRCPNGHGVQLIQEVTPPPDTEPTELGTLQWPVAVTDTDIALTAAPTTVDVGSVFLIDSEYMTVDNISNLDNPGVTRGTHGSTAAAHEAGTEVSIWGTAQPAAAAASAPAADTQAKKN